MKKMGLAVCYDTKNFGSQLQVLATQKKVGDFGCDYEIIRYKKTLSISFVFQQLPRLFNLQFWNSKKAKRSKNKEISQYPEISSQIKIRNSRFDKFVNEYFTKISDPYIGWDALKNGTNNYDAFLCGSDQLWLPSNLESHFYTLEFAPDNKAKIAYATSFGVSEIPSYQKTRTKKYLERFQHLSTRELQGAKIVEDLTGKKIETVIDPTLLFSGEEWLKIIPNKKVVDEKYIFCYFLGTNTEHRKIAQELKEKTGYSIVTIPFLDNFVNEDMTFGDQRLFDVDSADFVNLIRNAEYICTDSFHGSVFSILNHKKFMTFNRFNDNSKNSRNSRIDSLCELLSLNHIRYSGDVLKINEEIDYDLVEEKLQNLRTNSLDYLKKSL